MGTKKDYTVIAKILKHESSELLSLDAITGCDISQGMEAVNNIAEHFASYLEIDNPKFDRKRFLEACKGD